MAITTSLLKLTLNCAVHGDKFYTNDSNQNCAACNFLLDYNHRLTEMNKELEKLTTGLEDLIKNGKVVAVSVGRSFSIGAL